MAFYAYVLRYSAANLQVTAENQNFLLHESGGAYIPVSDPTPDSDGVFHAGEFDNDPSATETGPGVLSRVTIETLETATPGVYDLTLTNAVTSDASSDPSAEVFPADAVGNAVVVVGPVAMPDPCGDDDGDGTINAQDRCPAVSTPWAVPSGDEDCDGWSTIDENAIGTNPNLTCGVGGWPPDFNNSQDVDIFDVLFLAPPVFFSSAPGPPYQARFDLAPSGQIDIFDVLKMAPPIFFATCTPLSCTTELSLEVNICLWTDKTDYALGEPVTISLLTTNISPSPLTLSFSSSCLTDFAVMPGWDSTVGRLCAAGIVDIALAPGETLTDSIVWNQADNSGSPVGPGNYSVVGYLNTGSCPESSCAVPPPGSSYTIDILSP
jgi:hypothetical protein